MQITAKFIIAEVFKITGRGIVFAGYVAEGSVSISDTIEFTAFGQIFRRKIISLEEVRKSEPSNIKTGLLIKCKNEIEIDELKNWEPQNQLAIVCK